jgi:VWFA-related protein
MRDSLPKLKNAVMRLIDDLREGDAVAVFGFSDNLVSLQDFTTDKRRAKHAVLKVQASGRTALYDATALVARHLMNRSGKKAVVVFTDGDDNASVLNSSNATDRARKLGVPVYSVAQGEALGNGQLVDQLERLSKATGAKAFTVRKVDDVEEVFLEISRDLKHTYMLAYRPPEQSRGWHKIDVAVPAVKKATIRAKRGYDSD